MRTVVITCKLDEAKAAKALLEKYTISEVPTPEMLLMLKFSGKLHKAIVHTESAKRHTEVEC